MAVYRADGPPKGANVEVLYTSPEEAAAVSAFVADALSAGGACGPAAEGCVPVRIPVELIHSAYGSTEFYEARGRYSLFYTCNNWDRPRS